jgi:hypothetical protein
MKQACALTWARFADRKMLEPTLNFQLVGGTLEASRAAYVRARAEGTPFPRLRPEEVDDALATLGNEDLFLTRCLVHSLEAVAPCAAHARALNTSEASECLLPPVTRLLTALPYRICAERAQQQRVRALCAVAAERAAGPAAQPAAPQPSKPATAGM